MYLEDPFCLKIVPSVSVRIVHIFLSFFFFFVIALGKVTVVSRKCTLKKKKICFQIETEKSSLQNEDLYSKSIKVMKGKINKQTNKQTLENCSTWRKTKEAQQLNGVWNPRLDLEPEGNYSIFAFLYVSETVGNMWISSRYWILAYQRWFPDFDHFAAVWKRTSLFLSNTCWSILGSGNIPHAS